VIPFVSQRSVAQRVSVTLLEARRGRILRAYRFNGLWDKKMIEYEGKARDLEEAMKERHAQAPRSAPRPFSHLPLCALPMPSSHMFARTGHARIGSTHC
jgi:hypothetical protein